MQRSFLLLALPLLLAAASAPAAEPAQSDRPLRPLSECIDASSINEWHIIDNTTMTVRTGPKRYVVKTTHQCPKLGRHGAGIRFHPSNDKAGMDPWRICGDLGETVSSRAQPPCAIDSVTRVDEKRFDTLNERARRNGSGAEQPTLEPSPQD